VFGVGVSTCRVTLLRLRIGNQLLTAKILDDRAIVVLYQPPQGQNSPLIALDTNGTRSGGLFLLQVLTFAVNGIPSLSPACGSGVIGTGVRVLLSALELLVKQVQKIDAKLDPVSQPRLSCR